MATTDSDGVATLPTAGMRVIGVGLLAALGSILVAVGLTDVLAFLEGYRPGHWIVLSYAQAFLVMAAGWALLASAAIETLSAARSAG